MCIYWRINWLIDLYTGWAKKGGPQARDDNVWTELIKFFTERFLGKFVVKWILKITPHLAYVATLPSETLTWAKQAINEKLQGSVTTYLRYGGVVNNQIRKDLLLSVSAIFFKSVNIWQSYCLMHCLHLLAVCWPSAQSALHLSLSFC